MTENKFNHETPKITKITTEKEKLKRIQFCKDLTIRNRQKLLTTFYSDEPDYIFQKLIEVKFGTLFFET